MASRGLPRVTARTKRGATLLWALFFIFSIGLQYMGAFAPASALAVNASGNANIGGFEIDGDLHSGTMSTAQGGAGDDFAQGASHLGLLAAPTIVDPIGTADTTVFSNGSKESDSPLTWQANASAGQGGKDDVGNVYAASRSYPDVNGHFWLYLGIERDSNNGTTFYDFEFNKKANVTANGISVPNRSPGDLLFVAQQQGSGTFTISGTKQTWSCTNTADCDNTGSWSAPVALDSSVFYGLANDASIPKGPWTDAIASGGLIGSDQYAEMAIDVTAAQIPLSCPGLGNMNVRSRASTSSSAQIKDFTAPSPVDISNCGALTWQKQDDKGNALGGATFSVTPNPVTGSGSLSVADNTAPDVDARAGFFKLDNVIPGTYTITETAAPTGYSIDPNAAQSGIVVSAFQTKAVTYVWKNPEILSSIKVVKLDGLTNAPLAGAVFGLRSTATGADITTCTTAGADGSCTFSGLQFGTYYVVEETPPAGYQLSSPSTQGPITINAGNAGSTQTLTFSNPHRLSTLTVEKTDAEGGAPLAGGVFDLRSGTSTGTVVGTCTTTLPSGTCSISNLDFGTYVWVETAAPTGYLIPTPAFSAPITITAANAGTTFATTTFSDPHKLTDITVLKQDAVDQSPLDGAVFALRNTPTGSNISTCGTNAGSCTFSGLDFGTYYVVEITPPAGYSLPAVTTQGPFTITAANAGVTVTVTFSDPRLPGTIKAQKVDANGGAGLPGAVFELRSGTATGSVVATQSSDGSGNVTFTGVGFGTYFVVEVTPPLGYSLPTTTACGPISISASNLSDFTTCTGEGAFTDAQKPASVSLDKQVQPSGGSTWSAVGLKGSSSAIDLSVDNGTAVVYRYVVVNTGQQPIDGLVVTDDRVSSGDITCLVTTLAPGASTTCTSKPQTVTSQMENTASVGGTFLTASGSHDVTSNEDSVIVAPKLMSIAKTNDTTGAVAAGTAVHYTLTLTVTNGPVASVTVVDQLPTGIGAATAISDGGMYDSATNKIAWNLTNVATGKTLTYTATVGASTQPGSYVNTATITSGPCVGSACSSTSKVDVGSLGLTKTAAVVNPILPPIAGIPQAQVGETITYTVTYTVSNGPLHNAVLKDVLPTGLTSAANPPVSISNGGTYDSGTNTITWNLGTLATGSGTVTYQVLATDAAAAVATQPFLNTASIVTTEVGPISATAQVLVQAAPAAATGTPKITPPPTSTFDNRTSNGGGLNLALVLLALAGLMTTIGLLVPAPSRARRRDRRG